jgi:hypothetical protein
MTPSTVGDFPLTGVAGLPNVTVAFPGEHWSDRTASGAITPGEAVVPVSSAGSKQMRKATASDTGAQLAIALRCVDIPDSNMGVGSNGPNEIKNTVIANGQYVHAYYSGVFHLTLVAPDTYAFGDLIGWDENGARPTGKTGTGSWAKNSAADIDSVFEVQEWRPYSTNGQEGILTVRSLRGQF